MKKLIGLFMITMMVLSLAACKKESDDKKFVLGLDATFAPMGFTDANGEIVGFDIDLAKAVCDKLGYEFSTQSIVWDNKVNELETKNVDCIWNGLSYTEKNDQQMTLSPSYLKNDISLVVASSSDIQSMEDMAGKKLAVQGGSAAEETLNNEESKAFKDSLTQISPFDDYNIALMDMETGNSDAVLMDTIMANYMINELGKDYKVVNDTLLEDLYVIGFRKDDQALCDKVWNALKELKADGTIEEISTKWFGSDITTIQ